MVCFFCISLYDHLQGYLYTSAQLSQLTPRDVVHVYVPASGQRHTLAR